jgi:hypothetical protein
MVQTYREMHCHHLAGSSSPGEFQISIRLMKTTLHLKRQLLLLLLLPQM